MTQTINIIRYIYSNKRHTKEVSLTAYAKKYKGHILMGKDKFSEVQPVYQTLAESDKERKLKDSKVSIPSSKAVRDAKEWVEENEK